MYIKLKHEILDQAIDMNEALRQLPAEDVERMIRLEFFDEQEILTQLLDHYCLSWGSQGSCSDTVSFH